MSRGLTQRQRAVIAALEGGMTYAQVGIRLGIAASTVSTHAGRAYDILFDGRAPLTLSRLDPMGKTVAPEHRATAMTLIAHMASNKTGVNRHRLGRGGSPKGGTRRRGANGSTITNPAKRQASIRRYVTRGGRRSP